MKGFHPNGSCKHGMFKFTITVTGVIIRLWFAQHRLKKRSTGSDSIDITIAGQTGRDRVAQTSYGFYNSEEDTITRNQNNQKQLTCK